MTDPARKLAVPFHPSEFIQDEMDERGWDRDALAVAMGGQADLNRLSLDMYFEVGPIEPSLRLGAVAEQLAVAFGTSAQYWRALEQSWLDHCLAHGGKHDA